MKRRYIKLTFESLGLQLFFSVASFIFMEFFSWLEDSIWVYSMLTGWLFLGAINSSFWQLGRRDAKNNAIINKNLKQGQKKVNLSLLGGLKAGGLFFLINILVVVFSYIFKDSQVLYTVHRVMLGSLCGFLPTAINSTYWLISLILCFVMYIPCITAYIAGVYNFSLSEKIVPKLIYKSPTKKD